jgi:MinD superfamily P-loop ATPase containing an inserted ferredoxin domain
MEKRKIIAINNELCNGCGICVDACHEGALQMVDGKAALVSDSYCDGLGACLPDCPAGAITIVEREAAPFDEGAVAANAAGAGKTESTGSAGNSGSTESTVNTGSTADAASAAIETQTPALPCGCPGKMARAIVRAPAAPFAANADDAPSAPAPRLANWPVQIKLVPAGAPYLKNAALLVAADCTAFAFPDIHRRFMGGKVTLIGCPKLDECDYSEKLAAILAANEIRSVTVLRMEVPCCAGIANAVKQALVRSGKMIPWRIVTISTDGEIVDE